MSQAQLVDQNTNTGLSYRQAMVAHNMHNAATVNAMALKEQKDSNISGVLMSRKMDFFNSLLDKTNKNIEVISQ